jgi:hypothetical protein
MARRRVSACFGGRGHPIERQVYLSSKHASGRRSRHASASANEEALAKPGFEHRDLPADGAVGQAELYSRLGIAARSSSDLEDVQSVERKGAPHGSVRKFDGLCEKIQSIR